MRAEMVDVTAGYGRVAALRNVSLVVPPGRVVGLLGPNGAGKTTLLRVLSGLIEARSGSVLLDDTDVSGLSAHEVSRRGVCHITEGRCIFPSLTVRDNLRLFSPPGLENDGLLRAVDAFPALGRRMSQVAGTMSGGEQQMVALARAHLTGSSLVLLDEPSMGLAPIIVDAIFDFVDRLKRESVSILLVEQFASRVRSIADSVYVLVRGAVVFAGEPSELTDDDLTRHYLGAAVG